MVSAGSSSSSSSSSRRRISGVLLDLTGTLHVGSAALPGAVEAVRKLVAALPANVRVLTNTSNKSLSSLHRNLHDMGFTCIERSQIYTSVLATKEYLKRNGLRPLCIMEDTDDFDGEVPLAPPHNCVVVGLSPSESNYERLNEAYHVLQQFPDGGLVCMHRGTYVKNEAGGRDLGPGAFVAALEAAAGVEARVMGKPSREFFECACFPDTPLEEMCMVGDSVEMDVCEGFGTNILVQTGKYVSGDENKGKGGPTIVVPSIVEAVEYILQHTTTDNGNA